MTERESKLLLTTKKMSPTAMMTETHSPAGILSLDEVVIAEDVVW
jgi:hypothetical protein